MMSERVTYLGRRPPHEKDDLRKDFRKCDLLRYEDFSEKDDLGKDVGNCYLLK